MMPKTKIRFDELDVKCLKEMPLLLEVITSTGNKIKGIFTSFYSEMNQTVKSNLKQHWEIGKRSYDCHFFPLTFYNEDSPKFSLSTLETGFRIECATLVRKVLDEKEINFFWTFFGYKCFIEDEETTNKFYFSIAKGNLSEKYGGIHYNLKFYTDIQEKLSKEIIEISHPEKGDNIEWIDIILKDFSEEQLYISFNNFKEYILTPFLKNLK